MDSPKRFNRRSFVRLCAGAAALAAADPRMLAAGARAAEARAPARLVHPDGRPLDARTLEPGVAYLFHYPYVSTPCFLLDLGEPLEPVELETEDGEPYTWRGGVGPEASIVAFSAICSHRMTHPAPSVSFINYRERPVRYTDKQERPRVHERVIHCCSEKSVFDPTRGARVLGGPAPQPLASVLLDYEASDGALAASGTLGGTLFERFLEEFGFRLTLTYGSDFGARIGEETAVQPLTEFTAQQVFCG